MLIKPVENPSIGVQALIDAVKERKLPALIRKAQPKAGPAEQKKLHDLAYFIVNGKANESYSMIYILREAIPPVWYFYQPEERNLMPEPLEYKPLHKKTEFYDNKRNVMTCAMRRLFQLPRGRGEENNIQSWCEKRKLNINAVRYCMSRKARPKEGGAKRFGKPGLELIRALRDEIHPDEWFIFEDEIIKK